MKQRYLIIDVTRCHDCNNCFVACKDEHVDNAWLPYTEAQPRHGHRWMNVLRTERGQYPRIDVCFLPMPCQHCQDAPCVKAHPDCISRREDGVVLIDPAKAKGKKDLAKSCPYGAIYWNDEVQSAQKCTLCAHLLDGDEEVKTPRCAHSCPTGALSFHTLEPREMEQKIKEEGLETYRSDLGTRPNVFYKNLYRFTKAFVAGGVLKDDECAEGVVVSLKGKGIDLKHTTDAFGDFKFDALVPGEYSLEVDGREVRKVQLEKSVDVGYIAL
nr:4Fe-4S dicluster domain-containing protein [uncultured Holophaga sp.]